MKNKLWIFGDSYSTGWVHQDNKIENNWTRIVADKLDLELINTAEAGNSNLQVGIRIVENIPNINENDIVIYQSCFWETVRVIEANIMYFDNNDWQVKEENGVGFRVKKSEETLSKKPQIIQSNSELYIKFYTLLKTRTNNVFCWYLNKGNLSQYNVDSGKFILNLDGGDNFYEWLDEHPEYWTTKGDKHLNQEGHELWAEHIHKTIVNEAR